MAVGVAASARASREAPASLPAGRVPGARACVWRSTARASVGQATVWRGAGSAVRMAAPGPSSLPSFAGMPRRARQARGPLRPCRLAGARKARAGMGRAA
eukprot:5310552-Lingulodinium_polyedra.AAC.1